MGNIKFKFSGIPSGDYTSFCWDVDKETYKRITGDNPGDEKRSVFYEGLYRLYPVDIYTNSTMNFYDSNKKCLTEIEISETEESGNPII